MKIAISGAGIAGPALAYWLDRTGHTPTIIEKAPHFRTGGYIIDFWGVGYSMAEKMGILPEVRSAGYQVQEVRFVDGKGRKVGGFSTAVIQRLTQDRFTSLPRGDLAATIFGAVSDRIETIFDDSVSAVEEHERGVRVQFERTATRDFDLLVGAGGLHSPVRGLVFGAEDKFEKHLGYEVAAFEVKGYRPRDELVYVSYTTPGRQAARFSLHGDRTLFLFIFATEPGSRPEPHRVEDRKALLHRLFDGAGWECPEILRAMDGVEDVYLDRVSQIRMSGWSKGRVVLIGDAAAAVSLLAGEGTGLAMTQAYVLAGELSRTGDDYAEAFRRYEERLRPFIEGKQKMAQSFASSFAPKTALGVWVRNQATKLLAFPPLASLLIGRNLRDDIELPDYAM